MYPPSLREIQEGFWHSIARHPGECIFDRRFLANVKDGPRLDRIGRVEVYSDAYFLRLRGVLAEDFPETARMVGEDGFDQIARDYLRAFPSEDPSVRYLGRNMAGFLETRSDVPPYTGALARLEWLMNAVFDAPDARALRLDELRAIAPERWPGMRFRPIPALTVMYAGWPVHELWSGGDAARMRPAPTWIRIWRARDDHVFHAPIDAREAEALKRMMGGESFAAICDAYSDLSEGAAAQESTATLALWLECGLIAVAK